ncbi:MAG: hypothetical protein CVU40_11675 [Chloroflexi bacterium HGW-Chloroflexi-2]|jgi:hypothetical protein|nr:MAG: hypothetical protein CVU40_11675 [Chloroflexi bacterium HGW-Chloroflexi-2]
MQKKVTLPINLNINIDENLTDNPILEALSQFRVIQSINQKRLDLQSNPHFCSILQNLMMGCKTVTIQKSFPFFSDFSCDIFHLFLQEAKSI